MSARHSIEAQRRSRPGAARANQLYSPSACHYDAQLWAMMGPAVSATLWTYRGHALSRTVGSKSLLTIGGIRYMRGVQVSCFAVIYVTGRLIKRSSTLSAERPARSRPCHARRTPTGKAALRSRESFTPAGLV